MRFANIASPFLVIWLALPFTVGYADDDAQEFLNATIASHDREKHIRAGEGDVVVWSELPARGAIPFRGNQTVYFVVRDTPAEGVVRFPRLNNQVRAAFVMNGQAESATGTDEILPWRYRNAALAALTQTPTEWSLAIPADFTVPLVVALDLVGAPIYSPEPFIVAPSADGTVVLPAHHAVVHGEKLQFEPLPHKNTIGYWANASDWVEWRFEAPPGEYTVMMLQGCGEGQGGSQVQMQIDEAVIDFEVLETGHFQNFRWREMGELTLADLEAHQLSLRTMTLANFAVMDVRQIRLVPVNAEPSSECDVRDVVPDVVLPPLFDGPPSTGRRVVHTLPDASEGVYHTVYLPTDWRDDRTYPVLVELAGNGPYENAIGDTCTGRIEDAELGIGLTGGDGWIVVGLPFLNAAGTETVTQWWGESPDYDPTATLDYWKRAIENVCEHHGGNRECIVLAGFSRGSIACNYLGLHDAEIAGMWKGFICCSHYDGVIETWPYPAAGRASAIDRLQRLNGRPQFILAESSDVAGASLEAVQSYLDSTAIEGRWTFASTGFVNHSDDWALRPCSARQQVRAWLEQLRSNRLE